jgi:hypothetical protein
MKNKSIYKGILIVTISTLLGTFAMGQTSTAHQHPDASKDGDPADLASKIELLMDKVQQLESQVQAMTSGDTKSNSKGMGGMGMKGKTGGMKATNSDSSSSMKMGGMKGMKGGMGSMNSDSSSSMNMSGQKGMGMGKGGMGSMNSDSSSSMNMSGQKGMGGMGMMKGKGMGMMGSMKDMTGSPMTSMQSSLPGFPGASHLYHIGSTDFFLDHGDHIDLTTAQQTELNQIKEKANLDQASVERSIEETEQELWELTAADSPDMKSIGKKIREIEELKSNKRLGFIQSVGKAAKVLTPDQHHALTGMDDSSGNTDHSSH